MSDWIPVWPLNRKNPSTTYYSLQFKDVVKVHYEIDCYMKQFQLALDKPKEMWSSVTDDNPDGSFIKIESLATPYPEGWGRITCNTSTSSITQEGKFKQLDLLLHGYGIMTGENNTDTCIVQSADWCMGNLDQDVYVRLKQACHPYEYYEGVLKKAPPELYAIFLKTVSKLNSMFE